MARLSAEQALRTRARPLSNCMPRLLQAPIVRLPMKAHGPSGSPRPLPEDGATSESGEESGEYCQHEESILGKTTYRGKDDPGIDLKGEAASMSTRRIPL